MPSKIDLKEFMSLSDELLCVFDQNGCVLSMHGEWFAQTGVQGCQSPGFNIKCMFKEPERFLQKLATIKIGEDRKIFAELNSTTDQFREVKIHVKKKSSDVFIAAFHDLTDVMNQRHQYEGVASDLNYVLKSVGIGLAELDLQTREVSADETSLVFFGLPPDERKITEAQLRSVFHTEDLRKVLSESTKFLKQESRYSSVLRVLDQNTKQVRRYVQIHAYIIRNSAGRAQKLRGAVVDVTQEKTNELALKNQYKFLQNILDKVPFGIFARDPNDHFKYLLWNKYLEKATTAPASFVIGKDDYDLFPKSDADEARKTDLWILEKNAPIEYSERRTMPDGRKLWAHISKLPVYNEQGLPIMVMGLASDISLERENHITLNRQRESLTQASKMAALGEMAGGIAHEINNPLAIIKGRAEQIRRIALVPPIDADAIEKFSITIAETANRIAKIIKSLRNFAREGDQDPLELKFPTDLIQETLDFCAEKFRNHGLEIISSVLNNPRKIECRSVQISQVLLNLFNNSFDAVESLETKWIKHEVIYLEEFARLELSDSGSGIPKTVADKIMQPFFTTKPVGKGTGLGLSISKSIIEDHGGKFYLDETCPNTKFIIELPYIQKRNQSDLTLAT